MIYGESTYNSLKRLQDGDPPLLPWEKKSSGYVYCFPKNELIGKVNLEFCMKFHRMHYL